jgi:hypothetical protein
MRPLVDDIQADPARRPAIDEVVARFVNIHIQKALSGWKLRSTLLADGNFRFCPSGLWGTGGAG